MTQWFLRSRLCVALISLVAGCLSVPVFEPHNIPQYKGAAVGRFSITLDQQPRQGCTVHFAAPNNPPSHITLDETGWVFSSFWQGTNALARVECPVYRGKMVAHLGNRLKFQVPGDGTIAYFGHVHIELNGRFHPFIDRIRGIEQKPVELKVESNIDDAVREYDTRYRGFASTLRVVDGLRGATSPDLVEEHSELDGLKVAWRGLPASLPNEVVFGFLLEGSGPTLADCKRFTLVVDGQPLDFVPEYWAAANASPAREVLQVRLDLATLRTLAAGERVDLKACSVERSFTPQAIAVTRIFGERFEERLGSQGSTATGATGEGTE
ncbi:MAG: hypothetical protein QM778_12120 [Myxococcales bacterium]